jgi:hypothetical protein
MDFDKKLSAVKTKAKIKNELNSFYIKAENFIFKIPRQLKKANEKRKINYLSENIHSILLKKADKYVLGRLAKGNSAFILKEVYEKRLLRVFQREFYIPDIIDRIYEEYKLEDYLHTNRVINGKCIDVDNLYSYLINHYKKENQLSINNVTDYDILDCGVRDYSSTTGIRITLK